MGLWKLAAVLMGQLKSVCAIQMRMLGRRTSNIHSVAFLSYDAACSCWIEEERGVGEGGGQMQKLAGPSETAIGSSSRVDIN